MKTLIGKTSHRIIQSVFAGVVLLPLMAQAEEQLPTVTVEATQETNKKQNYSYNYKADEISSPKMTSSVKDTPQTITIVPSKVIEDQSAKSLRDTLRNVPGISLAAGEGGGAQGDNLRIRGFTAGNDLYLDGMRDTAQYNRDVFNIEQVEVIKGPSSAYTGRGSTGGNVNMVSKSAGLDSLTNGTFSVGTDETKRITADVNRPLTSLGLDGAAFRLNLLAHDSEVEDRDVITNERWGVAPSLAFGLGTPTRLTLNYLHFEEDNIPDYGLPMVTGADNIARPAAVDRSNFYGFNGLNTEQTGADIGTIKLEHDFNQNFTVRNQLRYTYNTRESIVTPPRNPVVGGTVERNPVGRDTETTALFNQTDLIYKFQTAGLKHNLVTGVEVGHETYENVREAFTGAALTSLSNPNNSDVFMGTRAFEPQTSTDADSVAVYAFDTISLNEQWDIIGGLRWDRFATESDLGKDRKPGDGLNEHVDSDISWRMGIVYKPLPEGSIYASYGTSFNPSVETLTLNVNNANLDPEKSQTYEIGTKWDVLNKKLALSAAVFQIEKTNARTPGILLGDPPTVLDGKERVRGFELGASGNVTKDWQIFTGYTFLDSEIVKSNTPIQLGREIQNTPRHSFNFWTTYELPANFQIGAGTQYMAKRFGNPTAGDPVLMTTDRFPEVEDYWTHDVMLGYHASENVDIRLNVYNLTDETYFATIHNGHVIPAAGRTAMLTTAVKF